MAERSYSDQYFVVGAETEDGPVYLCTSGPDLTVRPGRAMRFDDEGAARAAAEAILSRERGRGVNWRVFRVDERTSIEPF